MGYGTQITIVTGANLNQLITGGPDIVGMVIRPLDPWLKIMNVCHMASSAFTASTGVFHVFFSSFSHPMTDPWCCYINGDMDPNNKKTLYVSINIPAPWIRHGHEIRRIHQYKAVLTCSSSMGDLQDPIDGTICLAIFCGDIPLHSPEKIGLIYGRYLQFRILKFPLTSFFSSARMM